MFDGLSKNKKVPEILISKKKSDAENVQTKRIRIRSKDIFHFAKIANQIFV